MIMAISSFSNTTIHETRLRFDEAVFYIVGALSASLRQLPDRDRYFFMPH